jgi:hypothetical protein
MKVSGHIVSKVNSVSQGDLFGHFSLPVDGPKPWDDGTSVLPSSGGCWPAHKVKMTKS